MITDDDLSNAETPGDLPRDWMLMDAVNSYVNGLRKQIVLLREENQKLRDERARMAFERADESMRTSFRTVAALCVSPDPQGLAAGIIAMETGDMSHVARLAAERAAESDR